MNFTKLARQAAETALNGMVLGGLAELSIQAGLEGVRDVIAAIEAHAKWYEMARVGHGAGIWREKQKDNYIALAS